MDKQLAIGMVQADAAMLHVAETAIPVGGDEAAERARDAALNVFCQAVSDYIGSLSDTAQPTAEMVQVALFDLGAERLPVGRAYNAFEWGMYVGELAAEVFNRLHDKAA